MAQNWIDPKDARDEDNPVYEHVRDALEFMAEVADDTDTPARFRAADTHPTEEPVIIDTVSGRRYAVQLWEVS